MRINCVWEHNGDDSLLYAADFPGAFTRGIDLKVAQEKMPAEICAYLKWRGLPVMESVQVYISQEKKSDLQICDADSDVLFDTERLPLTREEYHALKCLVLRSAKDFQILYESVVNKNQSNLPERTTFYGRVPRTAQEMYDHTKNVNAYYFGEIGVQTDNDGTILECRVRGFDRLEESAAYLNNDIFFGSYAEQWTLRKVIRRFLWHDRIHAKAMYRMAVNTFGAGSVANVFQFE